MELHRYVVNRINALLNDRNWSIYKLAKETGINAQTIHNWFDQDAMPTLKYLNDVCQIFNLTLADFFAEGNLVELTSEKKVLHDDWNSLNKDEQSIIKAIIQSYKDRKM